MARPLLKQGATLDRLVTGSFVLIAGPADPDLALVAAWDGRRGALVLNRRGEDGHLALATQLAADAAVLAVPGAFLVPGGAMARVTQGGAAITPAALHLGDGTAYLCGREASGRLIPFDARSGHASAIDPATLPQVTDWRVMVPEAGGGVVTLFAVQPA